MIKSVFGNLNPSCAPRYFAENTTEMRRIMCTAECYVRTFASSQAGCTLQFGVADLFESARLQKTIEVRKVKMKFLKVMALIVIFLSTSVKSDELMNQLSDFLGTFTGFLEQCYTRQVIPRTDIHNDNWKAMERRGVPMLDLVFRQTQLGSQGKVFELGSGQWKNYQLNRAMCTHAENEMKKVAISISRN